MTPLITCSAHLQDLQELTEEADPLGLQRDLLKNDVVDKPLSYLAGKTRSMAHSLSKKILGCRYVW